ncbi:ribosomal protein L4 domain-containing protein [Cantharellus anzutake]|uniref:ribosomal protein L4 domain-containing protein n=1 Tax=Cantharellus anzutake TaxID=1750568 RepID=UPI00190785AD|nr:ribosomal protein L4 domain-containing protein [Cantharellus anzutake]KAF8337484.1 ribosomal protein L4 domain-containing protein [Cantharellus anzutake]
MFKALRNLTRRVPPIPSVRLVSTSTTTTTPVAPIETQVPAGGLHHIAEREADRTAVESQLPSPFREPIYLTLSSLIPRKVGEPRPSRQVVALAPSVFDHALRRDILHACVVHHLDSLRQGTASTKTRWQVKASGRKLAQQKGRGKARVGDAGNPIFEASCVECEMREKALELWKMLKCKGWADKTLFVLGGDRLPNGLNLASKNIQDVDLMLAKDLTVYDALRWKRLILDVESVGYFAEKLGKPTDSPEDTSSAVGIDPSILPVKIAPSPPSKSSLSLTSDPPTTTVPELQL